MEVAAAKAATAAAISVVASLSSPRSSTSGEQLKSAFALLLGEHVPGLFGFLFFYTPFFFGQLSILSAGVPVAAATPTAPPAHRMYTALQTHMHTQVPKMPAMFSCRRRS